MRKERVDIKIFSFLSLFIEKSEFFKNREDKS